MLVAGGAAQAQFVVQPLAQPDHAMLRAGRVDALFRLPDGRYLVGGVFSRMAGEGVPGTVRLQLDGAYDPGFVAALPNAVDFAVDAQGRIYACNTSRLVRLVSDGSLDPTFPAVVANVGGTIRHVEIDGDQLVVGGTFLSLNNIARSRLARVGLDGVVDPTWPGATDFTVSDLVAPGDAFVYVGGTGTTLGGAPRIALGRIAVAGTGTADPWNPVLGGTTRSVSRLAADADGLFIAGQFTSVNGTARSNLARIGRDAAATLDPAITTSLTGTVGLARRIGTHLYLASAQGRLTATLGPASVQRRLLRLDAATGAIDPAFHPLADTADTEIAAFASSIAPGDGAGRVVIGGNFARLSEGEVRLGLAALDTDGSVDPLVAIPDAASPALLSSIDVDVDGAVYVYGDFERVNGAVRRNLVRLAPNGSVDSAFRPPNVEITGAALHPWQAVYIADRATSSVRRLDRATGTVVPGVSIAYTQVLGPMEVVGEHLYLYGSFIITGVSPQLAGYARMNLATGTIDTAYRPAIPTGVNRTLLDTASQSLILVGNFTSAEGQPRSGLARYDATSLAFDAAWNPVLSTSSTLSAALDGAGGLYIGGNFTTINGQPCRGPARLKLEGAGSIDPDFPCDRATTLAQTVAFSDGRVYGAAFNQPLQRFRPSQGGSVDPDWVVPVDRAPRRLAFDATRVFIIGDFARVADADRDGLAALPVIDPLFRSGFESP